MVTHCVTKMITTCSPIIGQCFFLASFPAYYEDDDAWLGSISAAFWSPVYVPPREEGRNAGSFLDQRLVIEPNGRLPLGMQSVECSFLRWRCGGVSLALMPRSIKFMSLDVVYLVGIVPMIGIVSGKTGDKVDIQGFWNANTLKITLLHNTAPSLPDTSHRNSSKWPSRSCHTTQRVVCESHDEFVQWNRANSSHRRWKRVQPWNFQTFCEYAHCFYLYKLPVVAIWYANIRAQWWLCG